jgi:hypothetical protein
VWWRSTRGEGDDVERGVPRGQDCPIWFRELSGRFLAWDGVLLGSMHVHARLPWHLDSQDSPQLPSDFTNNVVFQEELIPPSLMARSALRAGNSSSMAKMTPPGSPMRDGRTVKLPEIGPTDRFVQVVAALAV